MSFHILRLLARSRSGMVISAVEKIKTILGEANQTSRELQEKLGDGGASAALAIALGKLCAEAGIDLAEVVAVAEVAHRETSALLAAERTAA